MIVNTTTDHDDGACQPLGAGDCTLREAINLANAQSGPDTIAFDIPISDPGYDPDTHKWKISLQAALPDIRDDGTRIDGSPEATQALQKSSSGSAAAALCAGSSPVVVSFVGTTSGFVTAGAYGSLEYLTIAGNQYASAVSMYGTGAHHNTVRCNVITGTAWTAGIYHAWEGITILNGAHDNLVEANSIHSCSIGLRIGGISPSHHNTLRRNWIGSVGPGTKPNTEVGIAIESGADHNIIGDPNLSSEGNVIAGNDGPGIAIAGQGTYFNVVANNRIGLKAEATCSATTSLACTADVDCPSGETCVLDKPNTSAGVWLQKQAAANSIGPGNIIATNNGDGVAFVNMNGAPGPNVVTWNSIYGNTAKGIHNPRLAPPVVNTVTLSRVSGTTSPACGGCTVEIFSNPSHSTTQPAQGKTPLGTTTTLSDGTWEWTGSVPTLSWVTTTLTKNGDTSEFSSAIRTTLSFAGKVCLGWQPILKCFPNVKVLLVKKLGVGSSAQRWIEISRTLSGPDGSFTLADERSETVESAYWLVVDDPRYRVVHADSSRGEALGDGSIRFTAAEPGLYGQNDFYVQEFTPERPAWTQTFSGTVSQRHPDGDTAPLRGAQVSLYGSEEPTGPGVLLASGRTGRSGAFTLVSLTEADAGFPYYLLTVDDPNYVVLGAVPGPDGAVVGGTHIRIAAGAPGERGGNLFSVGKVQVQPIIPPQNGSVLWDSLPTPTPLPGPPVTDLSVLGIELTQAVQCFDQSNGYKDCPDNSLDLTRGKAIAVRVYIGHSGGAPCPLTSQIYPVLNEAKVTLTWAALNANFPAAGWFGANTSLTFNVPCSTSLTDMRENLAGTANFILPADLGKSGWKNDLWVQAEVSAASISEPNTANNKKEVTVPLFDREPLKVKWALVDYRPTKSAQSQPYTGKPFACDLNDMPNCPVAWVSGTMASMYPMPIEYNMAPWYIIYGSIPSNPKYCSNCPDVRDDSDPLFEKLDAAYQLLQPQPDALVGWLPEGSKAPGCGGRGGPPTAFIGMCSWTQGNEELLAHEIGHTQDLWHMDANDPNREPCWPFLGDNSIRETGFDVGKKQVYAASTYDFMSASGSGWISPFSWNKLLGKQLSKEWALVGNYCAPSGSGSSSSAGEKATTMASATGPAQPAVLISGRVHDDGTGEIVSMYQLTSQGPFATSDPAADYSIEFQTLTGTTLAQHNFRPGTLRSNDGTSSPSHGFSLLLPLPPETGRILLRHGATVLAERVASAHAPVVSVVSPQPGDQVTGVAPLSWSASDLDGDALQFAVLYSPDAGTTWFPLALDIDGTSLEVDSTRWPGSDHAAIRVLASDGFDTAAADSAYFHVPRKGPSVQVTAPRAHFEPNEAVILTGHAEDPEDGVLADTNLVWRSDRQGILGGGSELVLPPRTLAGRQQITLTATDSDGQTATADVSISVGCDGDCAQDGVVTVDELLTMVNIALGNAQITKCDSGDSNQDGQITVDEILTAVDAALNGCE